jgi:hypothetical protein
MPGRGSPAVVVDDRHSPFRAAAAAWAAASGEHTASALPQSSSQSQSLRQYPKSPSAHGPVASGARHNWLNGGPPDSPHPTRPFEQ